MEDYSNSEDNNDNYNDYNDNNSNEYGGNYEDDDYEGNFENVSSQKSNSSSLKNSPIDENVSIEYKDEWNAFTRTSNIGIQDKEAKKSIDNYEKKWNNLANLAIQEINDTGKYNISFDEFTSFLMKTNINDRNIYLLNAKLLLACFLFNKDDVKHNDAGFNKFYKKMIFLNINRIDLRRYLLLLIGN